MLGAISFIIKGILYSISFATTGLAAIFALYTIAISENGIPASCDFIISFTIAVSSVLLSVKLLITGRFPLTPFAAIIFLSKRCLFL